MLWNVAAPFFPAQASAKSQWIDAFVGGDTHTFNHVDSANAPALWHKRPTRSTPLTVWGSHWQTASRCFDKGNGIITVFPQLAAMVGIQRSLRRQQNKPIVAWCFNLGAFPKGVRRNLAQFALRDIERFVVHSSAEIPLVATYLAVPPERVRFVPLQRAPIEVSAAEDRQAPFILAMGSANRDYDTLVRAARRTGLPLTIVASPRAIEGIELPKNVKHLSGLTPEECHELTCRARIAIVPLSNINAASGQVTVVDAQSLGRPVIATRSIGTVDYIVEGETGCFVPPTDVEALADAMLTLWDDQSSRDILSIGGAAFAKEKLSDEAAGAALGRILDELTSTPRQE